MKWAKRMKNLSLTNFPKKKKLNEDITRCDKTIRENDKTDCN